MRPASIMGLDSDLSLAETNFDLLLKYNAQQMWQSPATSELHP